MNRPARSCSSSVPGTCLARAWHRAGIVLVALVGIPVIAAAQLRGVPATLTPIAETNAASPGTTIRAALQVSLPEGFHVQSNKPRDPLLIPTVLTFDAPAGVAVKEIVFPKPVEARVVGFDQPLSVFEREFVVGVQFVLSRATTGDIAIPAHLRYQACNETTCFAPKTADTKWIFSASGAGARHVPGTDTSVRAILDRIAFGTGEAPGSTAVPGPRAVTPAPVRQGDLDALD